MVLPLQPAVRQEPGHRYEQEWALVQKLAGSPKSQPASSGDDIEGFKL